MADWLGLWFAPAILALVPALFRLRRGRTMARYLDDPAFPERLHGSRTLLTAVCAAVLAILIAIWPGQTWWSLPLFLLSFLAAGWPLRRVMFGETWSVGTYLWFYVRLFVAIYGFWLVLMAAPWLTRGGGPAWVAPLVLGIVLVSWNEQHTIVLRWLLRAQPLPPSSLLERCRAIVARSTIADPNIEYVDLTGGVLVNALALPDTERATVLFSGSLLERLSEEETAGIFAHEVAHLEHFNPGYLRRLRWVGWALVAAAVTIGPLTRIYAPRFESFLWAWPFVVFAYISVLTVNRQKHETESDARAAALTGDAEALVRGLVKLYALSRMPRRLDPNVEVNASHPSLARRVQAIRALGGVTPAALDEPLTLESGTTMVTLHSDRLAWTEADGTSHALPYGTLDELRVEAGEAGAAKLSAADGHGRRWTLALAAADVARAQAALDIVDARLRPAPAGVGVWRTVGPLVSLLSLVAALGAGQFAATIVALLAVISFERPLMRAAGASGLAGAALALRDGGSREMALILMLSATLLLFIASRDRREGIARLTSQAIWLLGGLTLVMMLPLALAGTSGFLAAHQIANRWPAVAVFALAFAAAAAWPRRRGWRMAALAAAAAGAVVLVIGDTRTLDAVLRDPFLQDVEPPAVVRITGSPAARMTFAFTPDAVQLSPRAESVAARVPSDDYQKATYHVGRTGAQLVEVHADAVRFVDERRILIAEPAITHTLLRLVDTDQPTVAIWEQRLDLRNPSLAVDRTGQRWRVLGQHASGRFIQASGAVRGGETDRREWLPVAARSEGISTPLSADAARLLVSTTAYTAPPILGALGVWAYWLWPSTSETHFTIIDGSAPSKVFGSKLYLQCQPSLYIEEGPVCSANDGSRIHLGVLGTADASVTPLAQFAHAMSFQMAPGWIIGWWNTPFALDRTTGRLVLLEDSRDSARRALMMTASDESIGVVLWDRSGAGETILEIYRRAAVLGH